MGCARRWAPYKAIWKKAEGALGMKTVVERGWREQDCKQKQQAKEHSTRNEYLTWYWLPEPTECRMQGLWPTRSQRSAVPRQESTLKTHSRKTVLEIQGGDAQPTGGLWRSFPRWSQSQNKFTALKKKKAQYWGESTIWGTRGKAWLEWRSGSGLWWLTDEITGMEMEDLRENLSGKHPRKVAGRKSDFKNSSQIN